MAVVNILNAEIPRENEFVKVNDMAAVTSLSDGALIDFDANDNKVLILVKNGNASAAKKVTFCHGDGIQGCNDLEVSIPAGQTYAFCLESGRFKIMSGANKGKIKALGESTDISFQVIVLP